MRVDFYILNKSEIRSCYQLACRLIEKAYMKTHTVYVHVENEQQAHLLDELLWTFRDNSFIPHTLLNESHNIAAPVRIGYKQAPDKLTDIMLNLTLVIPPFYQSFQRIIEIVPTIREWQEALRKHYRYYREQGCQLIDHQIAAHG